MEGRWFSVVYPKGQSCAFVELIERAAVERTFVISKEHKSNAYYVASIEIASLIGKFAWRGRYNASEHMKAESRILRTTPFLGVLNGDLLLPDGSTFPTSSGTGFFEAPRLVRAYQTWRDVDVRRGWAVVTEVPHTVAEEMRPLLAALPLLLFTVPPTV